MHETAKVSRLKRWINPTAWWSMLDMDRESLLQMMKCSLPPVVVIAISQTSAVANMTSTVGYLATITAVSSQCLLPRAKFLRIMFFNILATCIAASLCCLASYTAVKARQQSRGSDSSGHGGLSVYNSDACVVSAIWLIVMVWVANGFRAWRPTELQDPMVAFSIFSVVTLTRSGTFEDVSEGLNFISRLLKTLLLGFAIATGVSLLILPRTCRGHVFEDIRSYTEQTQAVLASLPEFLRTFPNGASPAAPSIPDSDAEVADTEQMTPSSSTAALARDKLSAAINALNTLDAKIQGGLHYSKMEVACGKLAASDLEEISDLLRNLLRPLSGMALLPDMLDNLVQTDSLQTHEPGNFQASMKQGEIDFVAGGLPTCLSEISSLITIGLQYFLVRLELVSRRQVCKQEHQLDILDQDGKLISLDPESIGFVDEFERSLKHVSSSSRKQFLDEISLPHNAILHAEGSKGDSCAHESNLGIQQQYFIALYLFYLQNMVADATVALASFARRKVTDETMARYRLIRPDKLSPWGWFSPSSDSRETATVIHDFPPPREEAQGIKVADPEHLVPSNIWERESGRFRSISALIGSDLSMFGLRVSVASFCVGILAYLRQTQEFFIRQRCIWAMIVIVIGMSPTSGQTMFGFVARIVATVFSVALSLIAWYIVDGRTAGVIIFLFLANMVGSYVYVKKPQYFGPSIIAVITLNVIIGYELQVRKLGIDRAESTGQPYYPIYIFGPYKLLAVIAGCVISFFWVIFPYPITAKSKVPRLVGENLFNLARVYSVMHATIELWIDRQHSRPEDPEDPAHLYAHMGAMMKKLNKEGLLSLHSLRMHGRFATYEPPLGGKFPVRIYSNMMSAIQQSLSLMSLMAYIGRTMPSATRQTENASGEAKDWTSGLAVAALESTDFQSHSTTSLFCHLGSAMVNAQPLPPFLSVSEPFPLARQLQRLEIKLLNIKNAQDPAFIAFISLEVLRTTLNFELKKILRNVRMLVGEVKLDV